MRSSLVPRAHSGDRRRSARDARQARRDRTFVSSSAVVRRRLASAASLGDVVKTMKSLASVRVHQYRRTMRALDASTLTLDRAARALLQLHPELADLDPATPAVTVTIVFGSERGLCGPFNERMARFAAGPIADVVSDTTTLHVVAVGRRVARRLRSMGIETMARVAAPSSLAAVEPSLAELLDLIEAFRQQHQDARVRLVYARPIGATRFEPRTVQVLPIDQTWLRGLRDRQWETNKRPMELSEPTALVRGLIRQRLALAFMKAYGSSMAAENAARLMAMEAASRSIEERLERLRTQHHAARRAAVTAELLDIQGAWDAHS